MSATISAAHGTVRRERRALYMSLSVLMTAIAVTGFWPKYFGPLVFGRLVQPLVIHIHAIVFTGWLLLFFLQAYFAATKRVQLHLKIGRAGIWYGLGLIVVGLTTGVLRSAERLHVGDAEDAKRLLFAAPADMLMFSAFFGAAIWYRKKPKLHRPAMVVAATTLLIAAVARMTFLPASVPLRLSIWALPVLAAMAVELKKSGKVHPIYLLGLAVFLLRRFGAPIVTASAAWGSFADWVFGLVA